MCCDNSGCSEAEVVGECPDCGEPVDKDGWTHNHCNYSPVDCQTCQHAYCDGSC